MFILKTERLALREWAPEDAEALHVLAGDAEVMRYVGDSKTWDLGRVREWIGRLNESYRTRGFSRWAVVEKESGLAVGSCGFAPLPWSGEIDFGYMFRRDRWGRGYASEITPAVLRYGFERYGFREVVASIDPKNDASRRVLEKIGFVYRNNQVQPGEEEESEIYAVVNPSLATEGAETSTAG
ncbi:MAG TPA: GNAT family N-acetyltransferase [Pyrinomonadaceae bacterium]